MINKINKRYTTSEIEVIRDVLKNNKHSSVTMQSYIAVSLLRNNKNIKRTQDGVMMKILRMTGKTI